MILDSARVCLGSYLPEDVRERAFRERMLLLLESHAACSRSHFDPGHLTASAFVLSPEADAVLLIFHKKLAIWIQPGGHVDASDVSLEAAARRELAEEVGLSFAASDAAAVFDLDIHAIPARQLEPAHEHFDVRFCFQAATRDYVANDEVADARWVELSRIDQVTADESVLRAVRKLVQLRSRR